MRVLALTTCAGLVAAALSLGAPEARSSQPAAPPVSLLPEATFVPQVAPEAVPVPVPVTVALAAEPGDAQAARLVVIARRELDRLGTAIAHRDRVAIVDYSRPSNEPRLFLVSLDTGTVRAFRVTHGKGSDPLHTGTVQRFSSIDGSEATSRGAYRTAEFYTGQHGRSMRLDGLDSDNRTARARAIVVHAAAYAEPSVVRTRGQMGRSQGCFALASADLPAVLDFLGEGRLLFADRI